VKMKKVLITGGAGFIGSHVVRRLVNRYPDYTIVNFDALTYAGNLENLSDIDNLSNYHFVKGDICDPESVFHAIEKYEIDTILHLAAESHVDRSIADPMAFVNTNVIGTVNLLNAAKTVWKEFNGKLFYHISTDEVYGSLGEEGFFLESTSYDPQSPYSASKAASDHFVRAYANTYQLPVVISNCSNNYGPNQFPEKLIPLAINNLKTGKQIPIYGKGENIRDWLYVEDHAAAIDDIMHKGQHGETYNIGGFNEWTNLDLIHVLCDTFDKVTEKSPGTSRKSITFVKDRAGHDLRYAIDASKISKQLGWEPSLQFEEGIEKTLRWYLSNEDWLNSVTSGEYQSYYATHYNA
jgi:dTDP-glucose 4,6-dehydratase